MIDSAWAEYRFADCVINLRARTVMRLGETQTFEPKVYDVIAYLIEHRERVVAKQELLDQVWGRHVVVTEGVIARTMMKARRLVGDDAGEPSIIRTIHRIGYRFVAELARHEAADGAAEGPARLPGEKLRLAILPVRNRSVREDLGWVDLGLMTALVEAFHAVRSVTTVRARDLVTLVGAARAGGAEGALDRRLHEALGVTDVLRTELQDGMSGDVVLHWKGAGPLANQLEGSVVGRQPLELVHALVADVRRVLERETAAATDDAPAARVDPYLGIARARALAAAHAERWDSALRLLRVALDIAPDDIVLQFESARCLARLGDHTAEHSIEALLARARRIGDRAMESRALHLLARHRPAGGDAGQAQQWLMDALAIAESLADQEAELEILVSLGDLLARTGGPAVATWTIDRAADLATALGHQMSLARVLDLRGQLAMVRGDLALADRVLEHAATLGAQLNLHGSGALAFLHLAWTHLGLGREDAAGRHFESAFAHALQSGQPTTLGVVGLACAVWPGLYSGRTAVAESAIRRMRGSHRAADHQVAAHAELAEALLRLREGQGAACLALLRRAATTGQGVTFAGVLAQQRVRALVCLGRLDEAADVVESARSWPTGRLHVPASAVHAHGLALIAWARGEDVQALIHLHEAIAGLPASVERLLVIFDAAWLHLEDRQWHAAQALLSLSGDVLETAQANGFAPALLMLARLRFEAGDGAAAVALQQRYCAAVGCGDGTPAARLVSAYAEEAPGTLPRQAFLPSFVDLRPALNSPAS